MQGRARLNVLSAVIRTGSTVVVFLLVLAILGKVDFGIYSYVYWIAFFSMQVGLCGIPKLICRTPQGITLPLPAYISVALGVQTILFFILIEFSKIPTPVAIKFAAATISCFGVCNSLILAICRQRSQYPLILISELVASVMRLLSVAFLYWRKEITPLSLLFTEGSCQGVQLVALLLATRGQLIDRARSLNISTKNLREVFGLGIFGLVDAVLSQRTETWFLALSSNATASIATFCFAMRLASGGGFITVAVIDAWFPALATADSVQEIRQMLKRFIKIYCVYGLTNIVAAMVLIFSLYNKFLCTEVILLLVFSFCEGLFGFASAVVYARKGENLLWTPVAVSAVVSITANLLLTPKFGLTGATISYMIAHTVSAVGTMLVFITVTRREIWLGRLRPLNCSV